MDSTILLIQALGIAILAFIGAVVIFKALATVRTSCLIGGAIGIMASPIALVSQQFPLEPVYTTMSLAYIVAFTLVGAAIGYLMEKILQRSNSNNPKQSR